MLSGCSMPRYHLPYFNWGSGSLIMLPNCLTHLSKSTRASDRDSLVYSEIKIPWAMFGSQLNFPFIILSTFIELKLWHVSRRLTPITSIPICLLFQILWNTPRILACKGICYRWEGCTGFLHELGLTSSFSIVCPTISHFIEAKSWAHFTTPRCILHALFLGKSLPSWSAFIMHDCARG